MAKKSTKLTDLAIRKAKPGTWIADRDHRGLRLYVQAGGIATWFYRFRSLTRVGPDGRPMLDSVKLGAYPAMDLATARMRWRELKSARVMGNDPKAQASKKAPITVADLVDLYITGYASKSDSNGKPMKKSWRTDDRVLRKYLVPKFGNEPANLTRADAKELLSEVAQHGDAAATQLLAICRKTWNYGSEEGCVKANPWARLKVVNGAAMASDTRVKSPKKAKEWYDDIALQKLLRWMPTSDLPEQAQHMVTLQLLTGCRPGEVCNASWADVDFERKQWRIPEEKHKAGRGHIVMLSEQALSLLEGLDQRGDHVFPSILDPREPCRYRWYADQWKKYVAPSDFVVLHSLRHSVITGLARMRCPPEVITRIAGHAATGITEVVYTHHERNDEAAEWLQKWADHLDSLQTDGVVAMAG